MSNQSSYVVVGGGQAGGWAATTLRDAGITDEILLIAEEPYIPYERPPLSKAVLLGEADVPTTYLRPKEFYAEQDITLQLDTRVTGLDCAARQLTLADGGQVDYEKVLLATGASVRRLSLDGSLGESSDGTLAGVHYLRGIDDALALRRDLINGAVVIVVGGGFIGLEVAAVARQLDCVVTVLEVQDSILNRVVPADVAAEVADLHTGRGVEIRTGVGMAAILGSERVEGAKLDNGEELKADVVVIGVGVVPNTELALASGIDVDNGIVVNEYGETSDPHVYAAGDVTNHFNPLFDRRFRLESWQNAQDQSIAVAKVMAGERTAYAAVPWFWSDQFDMNLQLAGIADDYDVAVPRGVTDAGGLCHFYLKDGRVMGAVGINRAREIMTARRMIAKQLQVDPDALADPSTDLRKLLKAQG